MNEEITLTDLFEVEVLQEIQDAFSKMTGISALITDANGKTVTKGSNQTDFCAKYTRKSPIGGFRCEGCDKHGAELALKSGSSITYYCHAGLMDFAAPIMAGDQLVGCFVGGQVLTHPPDITRIMQVASELNIDLINYLQAAMEVPIIERTKLENAADFLYTLTNILSTIAYHKYRMNQANIEIEKAASMKSDFLANMSHEIRTPMNAIIGLTEMALREDLPPAAKDYVNQIKSSGKTLLTIINDILDFSKIESGKMNIIEEEYSPVSIINDISNIIATRLDKEGVELILSINPNMPRLLQGDDNRIKQVIINLANNAVKFTSKGQVRLVFDFDRIDDQTIDLRFRVQDTGIGIHDYDIDRLFQSFQQLDSKRNRNIEGTGLGLAISKKLLLLMNGDIAVESAYGEGSTFSFSLPQKVVDAEAGIQLTGQKETAVYGYIENSYILHQLREDIERLDLSYTDLSCPEDVMNLSGETDDVYVFFEAESFSKPVQDFISEHPQITAVILAGFKSKVTYGIPNVIVAKKPFSTLFLAGIFNKDLHLLDNSESSEESYDFIAPEASILVVDDNAVNLTVCQGLLEPLSMQVDTALSGKSAIEKICSEKYDVILMDHMMPEIDGVETTHIIRRLHEEEYYQKVPIIALTANAVSGVKDMFIQEGMNDFIAKPIEVRTLIAKIKYWLPKSKIKPVTSKGRLSPSQLQNTSAALPEIEGLDTVAAMKLLGSETLFWSVLKDYYRIIPKKRDLIKQYAEENNWHSYTIEVHALKSASRQIGALDLSEQAAALESAGNEENEEMILEKTPALLKLYTHYEEILSPFFPEENASDSGQKEPITKEILQSAFEELQSALDELDMDSMESVRNKLSQYSYDEASVDLYKKLCNAIEELDPDACEAVMQEWTV